MKIVRSAAELVDRFDTASAEAREAFGDGRLYLERYVEHARHVEVQLMGDRLGHLTHLGERDCSIQRRHQKLIEEAPAAAVPPARRDEIVAAALAFGESLRYDDVGTVEFLYDLDRDSFFFLEMNTRVQVEHPVTEMVTGLDLVREQLRIAAGRPLSFTQADVALTGSAMEVRINAESPEDGFLPCPGRLDVWAVPVGSDVRVDTACFPGWEIPPHYDSLLAKVIVWGDDRPAALARMRHALDHLRVEGVPTTAPFARAVLDHPDVVGGSTHTTWLEDTFLAGWPPTDAQIHPTSDE
jgi:acetyl-CoA carboxylase biotin carboxylase subunit